MTDPYSGRQVHDLADEALRSLAANPRVGQEIRDAARAEIERRVASGQSPLADVSANEVRVKIVSLDIPFGEMVTFMVKWSLAAIPAIIILFLIGAGLAAFLSALGAALRR